MDEMDVLMSDPVSAGIAASFSITYLIICIVVYILLVVAMWKIFQKAGKPGWMSIIPILNTIIIFQIVYGDDKWWKFLLLFVPVLNLILAIGFCIRQAQVFGKGIGFGIGLILLPNIFTLILGFDNSVYEGPVDSFI